METTTYTGRLESAVAFSSYRQIDQICWPPMDVPSHNQNEHFRGIYNFHQSQLPIVVSSTDQVQPSIYGSSFDRARCLSGRGKLATVPRADLSTFFLHDESKTTQSKPLAVLPLTDSDNQQSTSETISATEPRSSHIPTAESNNLIVRKSWPERNIRGEAHFEKRYMKKYADHTLKKKFECDTCGGQFIRKQNLRMHILIHTDEKPYKCEVCDKKFRQKVHLTRHLRTHTGEKPFLCTECPTRFLEKYNLKSHLTIHATKRRSYKCGICGKTFVREKGLRHHSRTQHNVERRRSEDNEVNGELSQKDNLEVYSQTHATAVEPLQCAICWQKFSCESDLKAHCSINTCERLIICNACNRGFLHKSHLLNHTCVHLYN